MRKAMRGLLSAALLMATISNAQAVELSQKQVEFLAEVVGTIDGCQEYFENIGLESSYEKYNSLAMEDFGPIFQQYPNLVPLAQEANAEFKKITNKMIEGFWCARAVGWAEGFLLGK